MLKVQINIQKYAFNTNRNMKGFEKKEWIMKKVFWMKYLWNVYQDGQTKNTMIVLIER